MVTPLLYHAALQLRALPCDQLLNLLPILLLILPLVLRRGLSTNLQPSLFHTGRMHGFQPRLPVHLAPIRLGPHLPFDYGGVPDQIDSLLGEFRYLHR